MEIIISKLDIIDDIKVEIANWSRCAICSRVSMLKRVFYKNVCMNCENHWTATYTEELESKPMRLEIKKEIDMKMINRVFTKLYGLPTMWVEGNPINNFYIFNGPMSKTRSELALDTLCRLSVFVIGTRLTYFKDLIKYNYLEDFELPAVDPFMTFCKIWDAIVMSKLLVEPDEEDIEDGITEPYESLIKEEFVENNGDLDTLSREFIRCCCREYMGASRYSGYEKKWWAHVEEVVALAKKL